MGRDLALWRLIPGMLRRKEREATLALLDVHRRSQTLRREMFDLAQSVEVTAAIRKNRYQETPGNPKRGPKERRLLARAERREAGWQLAYNVACLFAVRADAAKAAGLGESVVAYRIDLAFMWFWRALERPGSASLTAKWVEHDPDLELLRNDPRYQQLLVRLREEPREATTTAIA